MISMIGNKSLVLVIVLVVQTMECERLYGSARQPRNMLNYPASPGFEIAVYEMPLARLWNYPASSHRHSLTLPSGHMLPQSYVPSARTMPLLTTYFVDNRAKPNAFVASNSLRRIDAPREGSSSSSSEPLSPSSNTHIFPVYVLPPKDFHPIVYTHTFHHLSASKHAHKGNPAAKSPEEYWYEEASTPEEKKPIALKTSNKFNRLDDGNAAHVYSEPAPKIEYVTTTSDDDDQDFPVIEASLAKQPKNAYNTTLKAKRANLEKPIERKPTPDYKTKLAVGLSSFFLGGIRAVSGRHWSMPAALVKQLEFMPNGSPVRGEEKYHPDASNAETASSTTAQLEPEVAASEGVREQETKVEGGSLDEGPKLAPNANALDKFGNNVIIDTDVDREAQDNRNHPAHMPKAREEKSL